MNDQKFIPGDHVVFSFWSSYKAESAVGNNSSMWYELFPGDVGIVIGCSKHDEIITVLFTHLNKLLLVHSSQLIIHKEINSNE